MPPPGRHLFRNDSGEQIPAFGVVRLTGLVVVEPGRVALTAAKPNTYGCQQQCAINGPTPVAPGKFGVCSRDGLLAALYDSADGTPAFGESWGPRNGTWKLKKNTGGFKVLGVADGTNKQALVAADPLLTFLGKADSAIAQGNSGTVSVWAGTTPGSESDTGENLTVYARYGDIDSGVFLASRWVAESNGWEGIQQPC